MQGKWAAPFVLAACWGCGASVELVTLIPEEWPGPKHWLGALVLQDQQVVDSTGLGPSEARESLGFVLERASSSTEVWAVGWSQEELEAVAAPPQDVLRDARLGFAAPTDWRLPEPSWSYGGPLLNGRIEPREGPARPITVQWCGPIAACDRHSIAPKRIELAPDLTASVRAIQALSENRALVFTNSALFEVRVPEGTVIPLTELSTTTGFQTSIRVDTDVYAMGVYPRLARIRTEPKYEYIDMPPLPAGDRAEAAEAAVAGGPTAEGVEVFVWSELGQLLRFDGLAWELLLDFGGRADTARNGLIWLGPGSVAFYSREPHELHLWQDGELTTIEVPGKPQSLFVDEELGLLVGSDVAVIYRLDRRSLVRLEEVPLIGDAVNHMVTFSNGFAYVQDDAVAYFDRATGWCPPAEGIGGSTGKITSIAAFPSGLLFGGGLGIGFESSSVVFMEDQGPARPLCLGPGP